ncbi:NADP-dependent oxidoreductase domain-containing protein [Zopfochytrium polystomum]|nr:NADP-dependent oxidoreductase domain-containing protein [Zopfochytrium polystomum]
MGFGSSKWQKWVLDRDESLPIIKRAYDLGINFFDTADTYSNGESELVLGEALRRYNIPRDQVVIATKVFFPVSEDIGINALGRPMNDPRLVNRGGLSRKHIFEAIEASLRRLGTTYIDLYQVHRFDYHTDVEETMQALHDLVRSGKQFAKMNHVAELHGWTNYNMLYREEERETINYCIDNGIAVIPWSPLARGLLSGKKRYFGTEQDAMIIDRLRQLSEKRGYSCSQLALAWLYAKPGVTAPICGASREEYLDDLIVASRIQLSPEEIRYLEEPYKPKPIAGHS